MPVAVDTFEPYRGMLSGAEFNADLRIPYKNQGPVRWRNDVLVEMCRGKRVLHIGCCDHVPLVAQKHRNGEWLHGQLSEAAEVTGVDIDADAVARVREITGLSNLQRVDITSEAVDGRYDLAVFGEVVEHIPDPRSFLASFARLHRGAVPEVVITVPNAWRFGSIKGAFHNTEIINSDHRLFFTPYTISKIAWDAGLTPVALEMATFGRAGALKRRVLKQWPLLAENIILTARMA